MSTRPFSRRAALKSGTAFAAALTLGLRNTQAADEPVDPMKLAQKIHDEIWRRFIDENNILVDYTDLDGTVPRPTADECRDGKPNALGWWTPTENGSMFNGFYLDAAVNRWKITRAETDKVKAKRLANGLFLLSSLGPAGFIARNVATDGKTPYPMGSNDQTSPWFYGLWRFLREGLASPTERERLVARMVEVAEVLDANRWLMPCNTGAPSPFRGGFGGFGWEDAPRLLFVMKAMSDLTHDKKWSEMYQRVAQQTGNKPGATTLPVSRLDICAKGMEFHGKYRHSWTCASGIVCLRGLWEMEDNPRYGRAYAQGLNASVALAAESIPFAQKFDYNSTLPCLVDWRQLNEWWQPQHSEVEAVNIAEREARELGRLSPRRGPEFNLIRESIFASWIVTMCPDRSLVEPHREAILASIQSLDPKRLYYSQFFPAESAAYRLKLLEKA